MKWVHINKYGVNELFDAEQVRIIGFAKDSTSQSCVVLIYKDGFERLICSDELARAADKCHELIRGISFKLAADVVGKTDVDRSANSKPA